MAPWKQGQDQGELGMIAFGALPSALTMPSSFYGAGTFSLKQCCQVFDNYCI